MFHEFLGLPILVLFLVGVVTWDASLLAKIILTLIFLFVAGLVRHLWGPAWIGAAFIFLFVMVVREALRRVTGSSV